MYLYGLFVVYPVFLKLHEQSFNIMDFYVIIVNILLAIMLFNYVHRTTVYNIPSDLCAPSLSRQYFPLTTRKGHSIVCRKGEVWGVFGELHRLTPWWRHQMDTFSLLLAVCAGNSPVPGEFPAQRPVTGSFDVFFDLRPNKRLSKQSWGWWFWDAIALIMTSFWCTSRIYCCRTEYSTVWYRTVIYWVNSISVYRGKIEINLSLNIYIQTIIMRNDCVYEIIYFHASPWAICVWHHILVW